ncbi:MAG TPA: DUF5666 domain-containing protein [Thermoanaerobaculia bacterium]|nr:DUF5666 domain-containing protein [Thermoanaerobaculia bacterium]
MLRKSAIFAFSLLIGVSAFGQSGTQWRTSADIREGVRGSVIGTVADVDEGRNVFRLTPDDDRYGQVTVQADAVSTQYNGFGGTINGQPEIFIGSKGFSNLRVGDRVEVRGVGRNVGVAAADYVTLLGRPVPADQTGVGQTRSPSTSVSTPTASGTTPSATPQRYSRVEGIVRQVNADEGRVVIETDRREMITIRGASSTPVYYRNNVYKLSNLEVGDRIRVEPESTTSSGGEIRARTIDVLQNVQESGSVIAVAALGGQVKSIDRRNNVVRVDTGRGEVRVDLANAVDSSGRRVRASDMQVGDRVDMSGSYSGDVFVATTVRFTDEPFTPSPSNQPPPPSTIPSGPLGSVTIYGTVSQSLANGPRLVVRDTQANSVVPLYVLEDFVVRTRTGGYTTADRLKEGDGVVVKAYRDADGNYIAQTIRLR